MVIILFVHAYPQNEWTVGFLDLSSLFSSPRLPLLVFGSRGLRLYKRGGWVSCLLFLSSF